MDTCDLSDMHAEKATASMTTYTDIYVYLTNNKLNPKSTVLCIVQIKIISNSLYS